MHVQMERARTRDRRAGIQWDGPMEGLELKLSVSRSMKSSVSIGGTTSVNQDVEGLRLRKEKCILMSMIGSCPMLT